MITITQDKTHWVEFGQLRIGEVKPDAIAGTPLWILRIYSCATHLTAAQLIEIAAEMKKLPPLE